MSTYSSNQSIGMVGKVAVNVTGPATLYTVPSGHYIIFQIGFIPSASNNAGIFIDGYPAVGLSSTGILVHASGIYAGPGSVVSCTFSGPSVNLGMTGVLFKNTP